MVVISGWILQPYLHKGAETEQSHLDFQLKNYNVVEEENSRPSGRVVAYRAFTPQVRGSILGPGKETSIAQNARLPSTEAFPADRRLYEGYGAARVMSAREDRRIRRQAVAGPQATSNSILQHVQDTLDVPISTRTISRRLVESGLHSRRPLRTLALTPQRRRARLEWCWDRATWMTDWWNVVFSD
ncbi:transposable element Tcb1 transposase [Trichonephila clavipes]|nr:transposable element Tcb1 transposase [Trichonephila clavipes]